MVSAFKKKLKYYFCSVWFYAAYSLFNYWVYWENDRILGMSIMSDENWLKKNI